MVRLVQLEVTSQGDLGVVDGGAAAGTACAAAAAAGTGVGSSKNKFDALFTPQTGEGEQKQEEDDPFKEILKIFGDR